MIVNETDDGYERERERQREMTWDNIFVIHSAKLMAKIFQTIIQNEHFSADYKCT